MKDILGSFGNFLKELFSFSYLDAAVSRLLEALGLELDSKIFSVLHFFLYDSIKIFFLLFVLVFGISYIQSYFPPERTSLTMSVFRPMAHMAMMMKNLLKSFRGAVTAAGRWNTVVMTEASTKNRMNMGRIFFRSSLPPSPPSFRAFAP